MLFDLSGKRGIPPCTACLTECEAEPCPPESGGTKDATGLNDAEFSRCCAEVTFSQPSVQSHDMEEISSPVNEVRISTSSDSCRIAQLEERFKVAKREAHLRQLRLRVPTVGGGSAICWTCMVLLMISPKYSPLYVIAGCMAAMAPFVGHLGLLPTDTWALPRYMPCVYFVSFTMYILFCMRQVMDHSETLRNAPCTFEEDVVPCWFINFLRVSRAAAIVSSIVALYRIARALRAKVSLRVLLWVYWSEYGKFSISLGVLKFANAIAALFSSLVPLACAIFATGVPLFIMGLLMVFNTDLRIKIQSWFMSQSESSLKAAGVAMLLGARNLNELISSARKSFRFISADRMTFADMEDNQPNAKLAALAEKGRLGFVDAFVSHSWHDDPSMKWAALEKLRAQFQEKYAREPKLWVDKYSIDQQNIDESLASLPIYLSGCRELWILCGKTYLERLWCIIEIFVFLEMGGQRSNLRVVLLDDLQQELDAAELRSAKSVTGMFDPRNATAFTDYDTERLHNVIETSGYDKIRQLICEIFSS